MDDLWRQFDYAPHTGQHSMHDAPERFKLLVAGARFGKSLSTAHDMLRDLVATPLRGWIVAPTYALTKPEFEYLANASGTIDSTPLVTWGGRGGHSRMQSSFGGEVWTLSGASPASLLGEELDWLLLCEAAHLDRDVFERYLRPRLSTRLGRMIASSTPRGSNWLHELYLRAGGTDDWHCLRFATWDNPMIRATEIESARAILPPDVFDEQYGGEFTALSGRVYADFAPATHVAALAPPPGAVLYRGVDFGFTNPSCCLWAALDAQGRVLVLHELCRDGLTVEDLAREVNGIDDGWRAAAFKPGKAWGDPASPGGIETLCRNGIHCVAADNRLSSGVDLVRTALRMRPDGKPGLMVNPRCVNLIRELENYTWEDGVSGRERVPRKGNDHALDALRYLVAGLAHRVGWQAGPRVC